MSDTKIVGTSVLFSGPIEKEVVDTIRPHLHHAMRKYVEKISEDEPLIALHSIKHRDNERLLFSILFETDDNVKEKDINASVERGIITYFKLKSVKAEVGKKFKFLSLA